eukprot:m.354972 g.354972  ORF g.354972 m.354972 type:complete len:484 (-) comp17146_c0_seq1:387-1838(-)
MDRPSSWAVAPERGLDTVAYEEGSEWEMVTEDHTFQPELVSAPEVRMRARSSGYGTAVPETKPRVDRDPKEVEAETAQEELTFQPKLVPSKLRTSVKSSGYGKKAVVRSEKVPEKPSFKPEMQRTASAKKMLKSIKSSAYGKKTASPQRPQTAPATTFRPRLPKSDLRKSVKSSGYGKRSVEVRPRVSSGNANGFDTSSPRPTYQSRYTLLADRADPPDANEEPEKNGDFILDGMLHASTRTKFHEHFPLAKHVESPQQKKLKGSVRSSQYGLTTPPTAPRPQRPETAPTLSFSKQSVLEQPLAPFATKTPLADKVRSHGYGSADYTPKQSEKPGPKDQGPVWASTLKLDIAPEAPPVARNALTDQVGSHGYGTVSPEKGPRYEIEPKPLWIPSNSPRVKLSDAPPVPRSRLNDRVRSHYGRDYDPTAMYAFNTEEEFDEENGSYVRHTVTTYTTEEYVDGAAMEEEELADEDVEEGEQFEEY